MSTAQVPPEATFLIDFNVFVVPAIVGMDVPAAAAAAMVGVTEAQFEAYAAEIDAQVRRSADVLLADPELARAIDQLAVPASGTMMAVGDSITTYRYGYARLLEAMVAARRADDDIRFLNVAQSGYSSTHCLEETFTRFLAEQPDVVLIKVGVNDAKIFGGPGAEPLVSLDEYRANMAAMVEAFLEHTPARPILLSPVPVVEEIANDDPGFQAMRMRWRNSDIQARADIVQALALEHGLPFVDLAGAFGDAPDQALYLDDGLHPGPAGHHLIVRTALRTPSPR